ncbi:hypothetical protein [Sphingomonas immobilis]|uniref:Uncharacterized protein n=1 Tax=Sphingomonas immobilis TaxID=3063997 RepID=A0ABT8ZZ52_9SPHN|nr:hypothetical protein [Sphingomonas sp. CA1-15]MDO7842858.1 hypothetical protein [Sphingomonas sp. CA1-15]
MKSIALLAAFGVIAAAAIPAAPAEAARHGWHNKRVCKTVWRGHHKVRKCRNVRVRW